MGLAVAGLKEDELKTRIRQLASGDWSPFSTTEQTAFHYSYQMTRHPRTVTTQDIERLKQVFGPERALDVIYYVAWGNYMTRIADAFQLPLERENPFIPPKVTPPSQ